MASVRLAEREKDFFFLSQSQGPLSSPVFACALERQRLMPESIAGEKEEEEEEVVQTVGSLRPLRLSSHDGVPHHGHLARIGFSSTPKDFL